MFRRFSLSPIRYAGSDVRTGPHSFGAQRGLHTRQTARGPPSSSKAALGPLLPDFSGEVHYTPLLAALENEPPFWSIPMIWPLLLQALPRGRLA